MKQGDKKDLDTLINEKIEGKTPGAQTINSKENSGIAAEPENLKKIFFQSIQKGDIDTVKKMLDRGLNPNEKDIFDATALMLAAHNGHTGIVRELLARGAEVDIKSDDGVTALMAAAYEGHLDIVAELLNHGADINAQSSSGLTALSVAKERNHADIINLLTEAQKK